MVRALSDLYPDGKVLVKHALRKALYCELEIGHTVTVHDVEIIKKRMNKILSENTGKSVEIVTAAPKRLWKCAATAI